MKRRILDSEACEHVDSTVAVNQDNLRQGKEQSRPNLVLHCVPRPVPVPQSVPVPRADQHQSADGITRYQNRQGRDKPPSSLTTKTDNLHQIDEDQIDELQERN